MSIFKDIKAHFSTSSLTRGFPLLGLSLGPHDKEQVLFRGENRSVITGYQGELIVNCVSTESIDVFFNAKSVAIYGASASQNSVGASIVQNFIKPQFTGKVYAVIGKNLRETKAERRLETGLSRCNSNFGVRIIEVKE